MLVAKSQLPVVVVQQSLSAVQGSLVAEQHMFPRQVGVEAQQSVATEHVIPAHAMLGQSLSPEKQPEQPVMAPASELFCELKSLSFKYSVIDKPLKYNEDI